ncbi:MAG: hypothetical protein AAB721_01315 [Patescibacteria group bacterium]
MTTISLELFHQACKTNELKTGKRFLAAKTGANSFSLLPISNIKEGDYNAIFNITTFPGTCGIAILDHLDTAGLNSTQKTNVINIIERAAKLDRRSAILYLIAENQAQKAQFLETHGYEKMNKHFENHNTNRQNYLYIKHIYA